MAIKIIDAQLLQKAFLAGAYNLDNNIVINFIGKWHLGQDINMNYYCEI